MLWKQHDTWRQSEPKKEKKQEFGRKIQATSNLEYGGAEVNCIGILCVDADNSEDDYGDVIVVLSLQLLTHSIDIKLKTFRQISKTFRLRLYLSQNLAAIESQKMSFTQWPPFLVVCISVQFMKVTHFAASLFLSLRNSNWNAIVQGFCWIQLSLMVVCLLGI